MHSKGSTSKTGTKQHDSGLLASCEKKTSAGVHLKSDRQNGQTQASEAQSKPSEQQLGSNSQTLSHRVQMKDNSNSSSTGKLLSNFPPSGSTAAQRKGTTSKNGTPLKQTLASVSSFYVSRNLTYSKGISNPKNKAHRSYGSQYSSVTTNNAIQKQSNSPSKTRNLQGISGQRKVHAQQVNWLQGDQESFHMSTSKLGTNHTQQNLSRIKETSEERQQKPSELETAKDRKQLTIDDRICSTSQVVVPSDLRGNGQTIQQTGPGRHSPLPRLAPQLETPSNKPLDLAQNLQHTGSDQLRLANIENEVQQSGTDENAGDSSSNSISNNNEGKARGNGHRQPRQAKSTSAAGPTRLRSHINSNTVEQTSGPSLVNTDGQESNRHQNFTNARAPESMNQYEIGLALASQSNANFQNIFTNKPTSTSQQFQITPQLGVQTGSQQVSSDSKRAQPSGGTKNKSVSQHGSHFAHRKPSLTKDFPRASSKSRDVSRGLKKSTNNAQFLNKASKSNSTQSSQLALQSTSKLLDSTSVTRFQQSYFSPKNRQSFMFQGGSQSVSSKIPKPLINSETVSSRKQEASTIQNSLNTIEITGTDDGRKAMNDQQLQCENYSPKMATKKSTSPVKQPFQNITHGTSWDKSGDESSLSKSQKINLLDKPIAHKPNQSSIGHHAANTNISPDKRQTTSKSQFLIKKLNTKTGSSMTNPTFGSASTTVLANASPAKAVKHSYMQSTVSHMIHKNTNLQQHAQNLQVSRVRPRVSGTNAQAIGGVSMTRDGSITQQRHKVGPNQTYSGNTPATSSIVHSANQSQIGSQNAQTSSLTPVKATLNTSVVRGAHAVKRYQNQYNNIYQSSSYSSSSAQKTGIGKSKTFTRAQRPSSKRQIDTNIAASQTAQAKQKELSVNLVTTSAKTNSLLNKNQQAQAQTQSLSKTNSESNQLKNSTVAVPASVQNQDVSFHGTSQNLDGSDQGKVCLTDLSQQEQVYKKRQEEIVKRIQSNMMKTDQIEQGAFSSKFGTKLASDSMSMTSDFQVSKHRGPNMQIISEQVNPVMIKQETEIHLTTVTQSNLQTQHSDRQKQTSPAKILDQEDQMSKRCVTQQDYQNNSESPDHNEEDDEAVDLDLNYVRSRSSKAKDDQKSLDMLLDEAAVLPEQLQSVEKADVCVDLARDQNKLGEVDVPFFLASNTDQADSSKIQPVIEEGAPKVLFNNLMNTDAQAENVEDEATSPKFPQVTSKASNLIEQNSPSRQSRNSEMTAPYVEGEIQDIATHESKPSERTHQSAFAKALAIKKQTSVTKDKQKGSDNKTSKKQSSKTNSEKKQKKTVTGELPLERDQFLKFYDNDFMEYERKELEAYDSSKVIHYAGDILKRAQTKLAGRPKTMLDDEEGYYRVQLDDHIIYRYQILKILGKGSFAQVVSCLDHETGKKVAIKINRNTEIDHKFAEQEAKLLQFLMDEDPDDKHNIVRMREHIRFRSHQCFIFELLHTDLFEHLKDNDFEGFAEEKIQSYAAQLLQALVFLEKREVIHCDLKPENILLVDPQCMRLKMVDFGSGCLRSEQVYTYVQSRFYRAPEVILRIPYSEKVDIWSLGCILAELYTGEPIFPGNNEQEQLEYIMEFGGIFPESMIQRSRKKDHYFDTDYSPFLIEDPTYGILRIPDSRPIQTALQSNNAMFLDFVSRCLELDPETRFGAAEAIQHPWMQQYFSQQADIQQNVVQNIQDDIESKSSRVPSTRNPTVQSRAREQDGARASAFEVSPIREDKVQSKAKITQSSSDQHSKTGSKQDTSLPIEQPAIISTQKEVIPEMAQSEVTPKKLTKQGLGGSSYKSPLKPSNDSLLEHYNYEKSAKTLNKSPELQADKKQSESPVFNSKPSAKDLSKVQKQGKHELFAAPSFGPNSQDQTNPSSFVSQQLSESQTQASKTIEEPMIISKSPTKKDVQKNSSTTAAAQKCLSPQKQVSAAGNSLSLTGKQHQQQYNLGHSTAFFKKQEKRRSKKATGSSLTDHTK